MNKDKLKENSNNKESRKKIKMRIWIAIGSIVALLAGIAAITGYSLKDLNNSTDSLDIAIGNIDIKETDECSVIFALQENNYNHPCVVGFPITIKNNTKSTAKNVEVLFKYVTPLRALPNEISKSNSLGSTKNIERITGEAGGISSSSISIPSIALEQGKLLIDAILWEIDISKIDTSITIDIVVTADDRPSRRQKIKLWSSIKTDPDAQGLVLDEKALNVDHGLLVYFKNYQLMKSKKLDMDFYTFLSMEDIIFRELETKKTN